MNLQMKVNTHVHPHLQKYFWFSRYTKLNFSPKIPKLNIIYLTLFLALYHIGYKIFVFLWKGVACLTGAIFAFKPYCHSQRVCQGTFYCPGIFFSNIASKKVDILKVREWCGQAVKIYCLGNIFIQGQKKGLNLTIKPRIVARL